MLNSFQIQVYVYTFKASIDSLLVTKGDRIFVQHDSALLGQCSGRIQSIVKSGGLGNSVVSR